MTGILSIWCPEMPVVSTNKWLPFADREAQELKCRGVFCEVGPSPIRLEFFITFPKTPVTKNWSERMTLPDGTEVTPAWIVGETVAVGDFANGGHIRIRYEREAIIRQGRNMVAQPANGLGSFMLADGTEGVIESRLPVAVGRPSGFGWWNDFVVDPVKVNGTWKGTA